MKPSETSIDWTYYRTQSVAFSSYLEELEGWVKAMKLGGLDLENHRYHKYYAINLQRMKRALKMIRLDINLFRTLKNLQGKTEWFILTEQWCGDAAQCIPLFYLLEQAFPEKIGLHLLCRDQNLELMDQFLTNGGRGIPKLIQVNEQGEVTDTWGPRPAPAQDLVMEYREKGLPYDTDLHSWYAKDKYVTLQKEALQLISGHHTNRA